MRAGTTFVETLDLTLPLREYREYEPAAPSCRENPGTYRGLRFSVGYTWSMPSLSMERVVKIGDQDVVQPIFPLGRTLPSGTLLSDVMPLAIPVIECG